MRAAVVSQGRREGSGSRYALGNPDHVVYYFPPMSVSMPLPPDPPPTEGTQPGPAALPELRRMLPELMLADQHRLRRHADRAGGLRDPSARDKAIAKLASDIERARQRIEARRKGRPWLSATPKSSRSASARMTSRKRSVTIRSSSSPGRPARARPPSSPRSAWSSAGGSPARSGTPSRGGSPPAPSPSGSPGGASARNSATRSGTRSASRTRRPTARSSS